VGRAYEQFRHGQTVVAARVVTRPPGTLKRRSAEYTTLRERVTARLGPLPRFSGADGRTP
jgi:hypothetical protein